MRVDLQTGVWTGEGVLTGRRTLGDLAHLFAEPPAETDRGQVVYETYGVPEGDHPDVLMATTVLYPGRVGAEFWMTRGHFHTNPARGEMCVTLAGSGVLLLADREGKVATETMGPGSVHRIDGAFAHRTVNVGVSPLVFLVSWMSDCGHDYESIERYGFPVRIGAQGDGWRIRGL